MPGSRSLFAAVMLVTLLGTAWPKQGVCQESALFDYVAKPDASFSWRLVQHIKTDRTEVLELRLHSQTWKGVLWKHRLYVIKPARLATGSQALLTVAGGRWRASLDDLPTGSPLPDTFDLFADISQEIGGIHLVLRNVPFQPLFGQTEDELIAYTLERYLETGEPDWPLLLPMVKSAVRAMDAGQAAALEAWGLDIASFTVIGGSKRGWTTWLTAAADERVTAIAPMVIDALNMAAHFPHQTAVWGSPSEKIRPYTERNLHVVLSSESGRRLREIIDPFEYRSQLSLPALIVNATNDEFFPVDSVNLYWNELSGPKFMLLLPNQGHDADDFVRLIPTLRTFHHHAAGLVPMPSIGWEYERTQNGLRACVTATPQPAVVRIWRAESDDRDFRDETWRMNPLPDDEPVWVYESEQPAGAYTSIFAELIFDSDIGRFVLSTTPAVLGPGAAEPGVFSAVSNAAACDLANQAD